MTLPDERYRAVLRTEEFLRSLTDPAQTPRIPKEIRKHASNLLRHYPSTYDLDRASEGAPDVFQPRLDELYKMVKVYDQNKKEKENDSK